MPRHHAYPSVHSLSEFNMTRLSHRFTGPALGALLLLAPVWRPLQAQEAAAATGTATADSIPVRPLGPTEARTEEAIRGLRSLRALSDGRLFVNDGGTRQVLLLDSMLKVSKVVSDTSFDADIPYGGRSMGMLPYMDDSTLLVDPSTLSMVVLDSRGNQVRIMAAPSARDINQLAGVNAGVNAFDSRGRLIYRARAGGGFGGFGRGGGRTRGGGGRGGDAGDGGDAEGARPTPAASGRNSAQITVNGERQTRSFNSSTLPDSVPILRADLDARTIDTVAYMRVTNPQISTSTTEEGGMQVNVKMNPLPQNDDWAIMADGSIAVVRVLDYRVDWYTADGTVERSAPLPFAWKRISDDDKIRMVDSLKTAAAAASERAQALVRGPRGFRPNFEPVEAEELPDYYPPISAGNTYADYDGNLWVLPATSSVAGQVMSMLGGRGGRGGPPRGGARDSTAAAPAGLAYDVINRAGELVERVQLPAGRTIAGFGPNGVVYLSAREGREVFLEKVRRQQP